MSVRETTCEAIARSRVDQSAASSCAHRSFFKRAASFSHTMLRADWFGAVTGFFELSVLLFRNDQTGGVALGKLQMNRHFTWMVPVSDGMILLTCGLMLGVLGLVWQRWIARACPVVQRFLAFFALPLMIPHLYKTAPTALAAGFAFLVGRRIAVHSRGFNLRVTRSLPCFAIGLASLSGWASGNDVLKEEWPRFRATDSGS